MQEIGRKILYTDAPEITDENIIPILQDVISDHTINANRINFLDLYDKGRQPLQRKEKKSYRSDIDCTYIDNVADEILTFHVGYQWSNLISLSQRGENDKGKQNEPLAISRLNECYEAVNIKSKTQRLGRDVELADRGYTFVDVNMDWQEGDSYFTLDVLNPRYTFIVYSNYYVDHRPMLAVTYRIDKKGNKFYTCFSKDRRFEIENLNEIINGEIIDNGTTWRKAARNGEENALHMIPIVEWNRSYDGLGCFERQIPAMDNLNLLISDFMNDVEQNTQAIWHGNDIDFPVKIVTDEDGNTTEVPQYPKTNDWIITQTTKDGKTPFVNPLAVTYDYSGMLEKIVHDRNTILQNAFVPQRQDNSGGSTGIATADAAGWSSAEMVANSQQNIMEACKMQEVKIALAAIRVSPFIKEDNPLLQLKYSDIQPSVKRNKTYEMTSKANFMATMLSHGFYGLHVIKEANFFSDPNQVWADSKELIEKYQASIFNANNSSTAEQNPNADRLEPDNSDQEANSPSMSGTATVNQRVAAEQTEN